MDHLSSCYFCGTALGEPLQEYPVVPEHLRSGDDATTATLCPTCHQKLETVLDAALGDVDAEDVSQVAADTDAGDDGDGTETENAHAGEESTAEAAEDILSDDDPLSFEDTDQEVDDAGDPTDTDQPSDTTDEVTAEDADDLAGDIDSDILDDEASEDETDELEAAMDPDVPDEFDTGEDSGSTEEAAEDIEEATEDSDDEVTAEDVDALAGDIDSDILDDDEESEETDDIEEAMEPDVPDAFDTGSDGEDEPGDAEPEQSAGDEGVTAEETATETTVTENEPAETTGTNDADAGDDPDAARTSISALEYNKVMRLLQNREFPVDRDEIETVAANAYGLSQSECAEVIDLAVDRGLIGEDGDQLVRPE